MEILIFITLYCIGAIVTFTIAYYLQLKYSYLSTYDQEIFLFFMSLLWPLVPFLFFIILFYRWLTHSIDNFHKKQKEIDELHEKIEYWQDRYNTLKRKQDTQNA